MFTSFLEVAFDLGALDTCVPEIKVCDGERRHGLAGQCRYEIRLALKNVFIQDEVARYAIQHGRDRTGLFSARIHGAQDLRGRYASIAHQDREHVGIPALQDHLPCDPNKRSTELRGRELAIAMHASSLFGPCAQQWAFDHSRTNILSLGSALSS